MNQTVAANNRIAGLLSALGVFGIWTGFIVFSRAGVQSGLTAFDVTALRFLVAGALVLPFAVSWWPRHLPIWVTILMAVCGPGALYNVLMFLGLGESSAAYGGVFANGSLPVFTMVLAYFIGKEVPGWRQFAAIATIFVGAVLVGLPGIRSGGAGAISGVTLFLTASAVLSIFMFGVKRWKITARQALALVSLPNAVVFLPVWYFFLPSSIGEAAWGTIAFHAAFQGFGPGFFALILFTIAAKNLGPTATAGLAAAVPASAAVLAIPVLAEVPGVIEWFGIGVVTVGLILLLITPNSRWFTHPRLTKLFPR